MPESQLDSNDFDSIRQYNKINGLREIRLILPLGPPPKGGSRDPSFEHKSHTQSSHSSLKRKSINSV